MNRDIANILKTYIEPLPFADKVGGLVKTVVFAQEGPDNTVVKKRMPIDCGTSAKDCVAGKYVDYMPNSKYKSVHYFEDGGATPIGRDSKGFTYQSNIKLVGWLNLKKLGKTGCGASALAISHILKAMPTNYRNSSPYTRILIKAESIDAKSDAIFTSKYTYDEEKLQFLMYPYDYYAINFRVQYTVPEACLPDWTNEPETCDE